ncbi:hypothetical protein F4777DRAFT_530831 [Nemania sp. FL0916]|nr:hypothetical protein F4777DRAFT_530831 [Nemania sp. FL0916]
MAPWSWWPQSTSKQQQEPQQQQQPQPQDDNSSQIISHEVDRSVTSQRPTPSSTKPIGLRFKGQHRDMPSTAELEQIGIRSLQTGLMAGGIGLLYGAGSGIIRSAPPALFALFASFQWFTLGSTYMASRSLLYHAWGGEENMTTSEAIRAGGVAGGIAGGLGGMIRGPKNILSGMLVWSTVGAGISYMPRLTPTNEKRFTDWYNKWSPLKKLTDEEYVAKLEEKILRFDAEIAIIDENIASLRESSQPSATNGSAEETGQSPNNKKW